jgi:hypothetical protein
VVDTFGQQEKDVREWLGTVRYAEKLDSVKGDVVLNTLRYVASPMAAFQRKICTLSSEEI